MKNLPLLSLVINFSNKAPLQHTWSSHLELPPCSCKGGCRAFVPASPAMAHAHRKQGARTKPNCGRTGGKEKHRRGSVHADRPGQQSPGLLPGHGTKPSAGRSRACAVSGTLGPERSRLARVKLKATTETEGSVSTPRAHAPGRIHFTASQFQRIPMKIYPKETDGQGSAFPVTARKRQKGTPKQTPAHGHGRTDVPRGGARHRCRFSSVISPMGAYSRVQERRTFCSAVRITRPKTNLVCPEWACEPQENAPDRPSSHQRGARPHQLGYVPSNKPEANSKQATSKGVPGYFIPSWATLRLKTCSLPLDLSGDALLIYQAKHDDGKWLFGASATSPEDN